jgi:hypothetical protein
LAIERPNRDLPEWLKAESSRIELEGLISLYNENPKRAKELFEKQYSLYLEAQTKERRPIHKGSPLHNWGLSLLYLNQVDDSILKFVLAYVEDTLNKDFDFEDDADRLPAARLLRDFFFFELRILRDIKIIVHKIKESGGWKEAFDPLAILNRLVTRVSEITGVSVNINKLSQYCEIIPKLGKMTIGFPQPREQRVFIGTNYDVNIGVIPLVKDGVYRKNAAFRTNYVPIAILDVFVPPGTTHDVSLALLHTCGYAIIDVSHPGGQFIEIERLRDYGIPRENVLLVRQAARPLDPAKMPHVSEMISTLGYGVMYYYDPRELIEITINFLP